MKIVFLVVPSHLPYYSKADNPHFIPIFVGFLKVVSKKKKKAIFRKGTRIYFGLCIYIVVTLNIVPIDSVVRRHKSPEPQNFSPISRHLSNLLFIMTLSINSILWLGLKLWIELSHGSLSRGAGRVYPQS